MKRVIPMLVITVWLLQAVTVNVHAAPFNLSPVFQSDPVVDLEGETPVVVEITNELDTSQIVSEEYAVSGDGTSTLVVTGTAVSYCYQYFGSSFCTGANFDVTVKNNNGSTMTLNACASAALTDTLDGDNNIGTAYLFWEPDDWDGLGNSTAVPFNDCVQYELEDEQIFTVGIRAAKSNIGPDATELHSDEEFTWNFKLYLSYAPINTCTQQIVDLATSTPFPIDPTIEYPDGVTDEQVYATTTGAAYRIDTDGYWTDKTSKDHHNIAVMISWDGELWVPALCMSNDADDLTSLYFIAESETLYIRVSSQPGESNWIDNTATDPYTYTVTAVYMTAICETQYTYSEADALGDVTVPGNSEAGVLASDALVVGEWYAIEVVSGTWQDEGSPPDKTNMELRVDGDALYNEDPVYHDLAPGEGGGVGCQSTDATTWYIQAQNTTLHLRVNNVTGGFTSNTGALEVTVYHAAFERGLETCEIKFEMGGLEDSDSVSANAENGKMFGMWTGPQTTTSPLGVATAGTLVPGAWYVLDTVDGPWAQNGSGLLGANAHPATAFYDMAVSTNRSTWFPLEEWSLPDCNIQIDALGHRRIYFQTPSDDGFTWYFRVDDDGTWNSNAGSLGWNLYRTTNTEAVPEGVDPWASCGDDYGHRLLYNAGTSIPVQEEEGTYLRKALLGVAGTSQDEIIADASSSMSVGDVFKLTIKNGPWLDGEDEHFDAAISSDDGATWYPLSDDSNPDLDCVSIDQQGKYYSVMFTVAAGQRWKVRVNDDAGDFVGNTGNLSYVMYFLTNNDAAGLGTAGSGTASSAAGLGIASGGIAVCSHVLMYPTFQSVQGVWTQPDRPTGYDLWEWMQWVGDSLYEAGSAIFTYFPNFISAGFNYAVGWINYATMAVQKFFAFCPKDAGLLMNAINVLKNKEPLASVYEIITVVQDVQDKLESFDWGDYEDTSLFSMDGLSDVQSMLSTYILRRDGTAINPWDGSNVVSFDDAGLPASFYSCGTAFTDFLPSRLKTSVCFVMAYFKETGAMFWVQLLVIDLGALSLTVMSIKRALQELIYMMTGVKPWTKSGANASIDKLANYMEKRDRENDIDRELDRRFGRDRTARDWRYK